MPIAPTYPGVYVQEVPSGVTTIAGVSTSVAMFVGATGQGPLNEPTRVLSYADYERAFGDDTVVSETTQQVRQFFLNGGQQAYIMRIAKDSAKASIDVNNEAGTKVITFTAREDGVIGDTIRIEIDYDTSRSESTFNLTASRAVVDSSGNTSYEDVEEHKDLTMDPSSGRYVETWLEQYSSLLTAVVASGLTPVNGYSVAGLLLGTDPLGALDTVIASLGSNVGSFKISVDGSAYVTVTLHQGAYSAESEIEQVINAALASTGKSVSLASEDVVAGSQQWLRIESATAGGSVRIDRASSNDISGDLMMGVNNGGLEVDGYAPLRPAPTGFVSTLGDLDPASAAFLVPFKKFLSEQFGNLAPQLDVSDTDGGGTVPMSLSGDIWGSTPSFVNAQTSLDTLVDAIETARTLTVPTISWSAERQGFRIALTPEFGTDDSDAAATLNSTLGAYDIGDATNGIFGRSSNVHRYRLGRYAAIGNYVVGVQPGGDGQVPEGEQYADAYDIIDKDVDIFNLMILPRVLNLGGNGQSDDDRQGLWGEASAFCQKRMAFLFVDPRQDWSDASSVLDTANKNIDAVRRGLVKDHSAVFWPRVRITGSDGTLVPIDPAGTLAGVAARTDANRGVWKAFAGMEASLLGVREVEHTMSEAENGILNPEAVNAIRVFPGGIVSWGARTLDGYDNSGNDDYRYIPVRRLALYIEASLIRGLQFAVFRPNGEQLWAEIRRAAGTFMQNLYRQGAFKGKTVSDSYAVICDSTTTTEADTRLGIVNVVVMFAPLFPAEFVVITLKQMTQEAQI